MPEPREEDALGSEPAESFPESARLRHTPKYPWDKWLDGRIWKIPIAKLGIKRGTIQSCGYYAAQARGLKLRTACVDGEFYLQALARLVSADAQEDHPHA